MSTEREYGGPQPFLVAFPGTQGPYADANAEAGEGHTVMLDPTYFRGLDEVGVFLADLARHFARAFAETGRARDAADGVEQIRETFDLALDEASDEDEDGLVS